MRRIVIGVDGGGSKTHVIVADDSGAQIAVAEGGPSAVTPGAAERSADVVEQTVRIALAAGDLGDAVPAVLVVGLAGVGRTEERAALARALAGRELAEDIIIETDAGIALDDAFGSAGGIILIAGTGSIAYGRGPSGQMARCGGWGPKIGDEGSGAWIGKRALGIVAAAHDGREPATALTGAMITAAQVNEPDDLIPWASAADAAAFAALAPAVFSAAASDARANSLVDLAAEELVIHVKALATKLFGEERAAFGVAFAGGLLRKGTLLRNKVEHRMKSAVPGATIHSEEVIAARGAVRAAVRLLERAKL